MAISFKDIEQYVDSVGTGVDGNGHIELSIQFRDNLSDEAQLKIKEFIVEVYQKNQTEVAKEIIERAGHINGMSAFRRRTLGMTN